MKEKGSNNAIPMMTTGCMGPCSLGNNVVVATKSKNMFFKGMNKVEDLQALGQYVKDMIEDPKTAVPERLIGKLDGIKDFRDGIWNG